MNKKKNKENVNLTEQQFVIENTKNKHTTTFRKKHSEFADICHSTSDKTEWIVGEALADFYLQRFRIIGKNTLSSGIFFKQSWTHQALFYRLYKKFCQSTRMKDDAIGVSRKEVSQYMKNAKNESQGTITKIISDAVSGGFVGEAAWSRDERIKLLYLTPQSVTDFKFQGLENSFDASISTSLAEVMLMLEKHRSEDDEYQTVGQILWDFLHHPAKN